MFSVSVIPLKKGIQKDEEKSGFPPQSTTTSLLLRRGNDKQLVSQLTVFRYTTAVMTTKNIALIIGGIILVGAVSWSIYRGPLWNKDLGTSMAIPNIPDVATSIDSGKAKVVVSPGVEIDYGYATETPGAQAQGTKPRIDTPSLSRPLVIPASFSSENATSAKANIEILIVAIKKNPENGALWANLGMARKGIEDYVGAKEAYEHALKLMPNNSVVAENLGVVYSDYLKDYAKAEQYFRLAISIDPSVDYRYLRLFDMYLYGLKDTAKAKAILQEGLRAIPGNPSFKALLETM